MRLRPGRLGYLCQGEAENVVVRMSYDLVEVASHSSEKVGLRDIVIVIAGISILPIGSGPLYTNTPLRRCLCRSLLIRRAVTLGR